MQFSWISKWVLLSIATGATIIPSDRVQAQARPAAPAPLYSQEGERAVKQLADIQAILSNIESVVERMDLPRLYLLRTRTADVNKKVHEKGLSHMATIREYQTLIVTFRYSTDYFKRISTPKIDGSLSHLTSIVQTIIEERGFDDSPYTQLTLSTFTQLRQLLLELVTQTQNSDLKLAITELMPGFGDVIARAGQGDRPKTFESGVRLYRQLTKLHSDLYRWGERGQNFNLVLNIQALIEFYGEYAQEKE